MSARQISQTVNGLVIIFAVTLAHGAQPSCVPVHGMSLQDLQSFDFQARGEKYKAQTAWPDARPEYVLGQINFVRQNVFPDRNHWLARQANRFNTLTSESALLAAFPFVPGNLIDERRRDEAERVLRDKAFLYDARVLVRQVCGTRMDLDVVVRDVWTLTPGLGLTRSGGDNETSVSLSDVNFLGTGKGLSIEYFDDTDRSGTFLSYDDPNILGSRWQGSLVAADNDDGERYGASLSRPFFALDTPYAFGFSANHFVRNEDLEFLGRDQFELQAETDTVNIYLGRSSGRQQGWVNRYFAGVRYQHEQFEYPLDFPDTTQDERKFIYPYLGWSLIEEQFEASTDIDRVGIVEDINLGWNIYLELGWSPDTFGGFGDYLLLRGAASHRQYLARAHLLSLSAELRSRYDLDNNTTEDLRLESRASYLWRQSEKWSFFASLDYNLTRNLPADKQLTLGGDDGLRGYPTRYQIGDRSVLATLEQRYYSSAYPFGLFRVGYAAFFDVGRAWFEDEPPAWVPPREGDHFDVLSNVGVGLRLESVRTRRDRLVHIDFAKPLVDGPFVSSWEFTITAKQSF
ncbi:MAG: hypothetical protein NXH95_19115 [Pseudomonadaceae bacterium]|nr:hypothetical protein [Pseudomonadaceae bacterium]